MKLSLLHRRLAGERLIGSGLLVDFHHDEMTENGVGIEVRPLDRGGLLAVRSRGGTEQKAERIIFLRGGDTGLLLNIPMSKEWDRQFR